MYRELIPEEWPPRIVLRSSPQGPKKRGLPILAGVVPEHLDAPPQLVVFSEPTHRTTMTDNKDPNTQYRPPSVERWGTVLDLTAGAETGGSGDTFSDDNPFSICTPADPQNSEESC